MVHAGELVILPADCPMVPMEPAVPGMFENQFNLVMVEEFCLDDNPRQLRNLGLDESFTLGLDLQHPLRFERDSSLAGAGTHAEISNALVNPCVEAD
jgi:hypothetical protein